MEKIELMVGEEGKIVFAVDRVLIFGAIRGSKSRGELGGFFLAPFNLRGGEIAVVFGKVVDFLLLRSAPEVGMMRIFLLKFGDDVILEKATDILSRI